MTELAPTHADDVCPTTFGCVRERDLACDYQELSCKKGLHAGKSFWKRVNSKRNQILFTIFQLIYIQTDDRLDPYQSGNDKYNLISV